MNYLVTKLQRLYPISFQTLMIIWLNVNQNFHDLLSNLVMIRCQLIFFNIFNFVYCMCVWFFFFFSDFFSFNRSFKFMFI